MTIDSKQQLLPPSSTNGDAREEEEGNLGYYFLSDAAARELPRFQYHGVDQSLLYKYVLSPLATFCVYRLTPVWLAPNTITLIALIFMVTAYVPMWIYISNLEPVADPPRWIFLLHGICMLIYQTLDNMDGKQARKTGNGSPLGLLFDHGCDAVNNLFGSVGWMLGLALHPLSDVYLCFSVLFGPYAIFFFGTWEEYYTGKLVMPVINGPNEGVLGGALVSFTSWWYGPNFWQETHAWDALLNPLIRFLPESLSTILPATLRNADVLILIASISMICEPFGKMVSVVRSYGLGTLRNLLPFFTLTACAVSVAWVDYNVWLEMPRTSLHLCSSLFVEMTVDLMMAHMTMQTYTALRWPLLPLLVLTSMVVSGYWQAGRETADFLLVYTSAVATYLVFKTVVTVHEISSLLNIWCFDITTKRQPSTRPENHHKSD
jgi:ethanolaminephosphotransferase